MINTVLSVVFYCKFHSFFTVNSRRIFDSLYTKYEACKVYLYISVKTLNWRCCREMWDNCKKIDKPIGFMFVYMILYHRYKTWYSIGLLMSRSYIIILRKSIRFSIFTELLHYFLQTSIVFRKKNLYKIIYSKNSIFERIVHCEKPFFTCFQLVNFLQVQNM